MSRNQMQHAQQLIKQGRYDEARKLLRSIDHPKAREWLEKLDKRAPARAPRRRTGGGIGGRIVGFLTYVLTIVISAAVTIGLLAGLVVSTASSRSAAQQQAFEATTVAGLPTATATRPARTGVVISSQN
ncbi:MAG: hypothetical protein K8J31_08325, partial [Anaerolineae bacterium]|nr:hypothetical protein [Anaerolineae bacterium]